MIQLPQYFNFPNCSNWKTFTFIFQSNFLKCNQLIRFDISCFINLSICTFKKQLLKSTHKINNKNVYLLQFEQSLGKHPHTSHPTLYPDFDEFLNLCVSISLVSSILVLDLFLFHPFLMIVWVVYLPYRHRRLILLYQVQLKKEDKI